MSAKLPRFEVHTTRLSLMMALQNQAVAGCYHWLRVRLEGPEQAAKTPDLVRKFQVIYETGRSPSAQSRDRSAGIAATRLLLWARTNPGAVAIEAYLLRSDGKLPPQAEGQREGWQDLRKKGQRLSVDDMTLLRLPKAGQERPSWTWRVEPHVESDDLSTVLLAIRTGKDHIAADRLRYMYARPGFHGIRESTKKIRRAVEYIAKTSSTEGACAQRVLAEFPGQPYWVRKKRHQVASWPAVQRMIRAAAAAE